MKIANKLSPILNSSESNKTDPSKDNRTESPTAEHDTLNNFAPKISSVGIKKGQLCTTESDGTKKTQYIRNPDLIKLKTTEGDTVSVKYMSTQSKHSLFEFSYSAQESKKTKETTGHTNRSGIQGSVTFSANGVLAKKIANNNGIAGFSTDESHVKLFNDFFQLVQGSDHLKKHIVPPLIIQENITIQKKVNGCTLGEILKDGMRIISPNEHQNTPIQNSLGDFPKHILLEVINTNLEKNNKQPIDYIQLNHELKQFSLAIAEMNFRGYQHNDIHTGNVMFDYDARNFKLIDFDFMTSYQSAHKDVNKKQNQHRKGLTHFSDYFMQKIISNSWYKQAIPEDELDKEDSVNKFTASYLNDKQEQEFRLKDQFNM